MGDRLARRIRSLIGENLRGHRTRNHVRKIYYAYSIKNFVFYIFSSLLNCILSCS